MEVVDCPSGAKSSGGPGSWCIACADADAAFMVMVRPVFSGPSG